ncbi:organic solvent tolerance protein OstA [Treponema sp. OMZ 840]|uniref:LptA/OstA family protein n=1 Tax=Treponema sp. OMZ 840 TaxID=244313 RepID=UPI003D9086DF
MIKKCLFFSFFVLFCMLLVTPIFGEEEKIVFFANFMSGTTKEDNEHTHLKGNAKIQTKTLEIKADSILLNGTDYRNINAEGNVEGKDTEGGFTFSCNSLRYDRKTKITVLEGSVIMYDDDNEVQVKAEYIEYNQNTETALIQINVEITQENSVCTAAFAVYRKKTQVLELNGSPKVTENDNTFKAQEIIFNLDTKEITLDGKVSGTVTDKKETEGSTAPEKNKNE